MTCRPMWSWGLLATVTMLACATERTAPLPVAPCEDAELWRANQQVMRRTGQITLLTPKPGEFSLLLDNTATSDDVRRLCAALSLEAIGTPQVPPYYHAFRIRSSATTDVVGPAATRWPRVNRGLPVYLGPEGETRYIHPRDIVVQFFNGDAAAYERAIADWGAVISEDFWTPGMYEIRFPDCRTVFDHIRDLVHAPGLSLVEPAYWGYDDNLPGSHDSALQQTAGAPRP